MVGLSPILESGPIVKEQVLQCTPTLDTLATTLSLLQNCTIGSVTADGGMVTKKQETYTTLQVPSWCVTPLFMSEVSRLVQCCTSKRNTHVQTTDRTWLFL